MSQWSEQFPFLKPYGTMRLLYRTDIFMIGLYLEKLRGPVYRVEFEVKQLWEPPVTNWDNCIYTHIINERIKSKGDYWIEYGTDYDNHDFYFGRALESTRSQFGEILEGTATSGFLMEQCKRTYAPRNKRDFVFETLYYEFQLAMAVYFQQDEIIESLYREIDESCRLWTRRFSKGKHVCGLTQLSLISSWRKKIEDRISDRDRLLSICEENSKVKKIRRLNIGELIFTPYEGNIDEEKQQESLFAKIMSSIKNRFT